MCFSDKAQGPHSGVLPEVQHGANSPESPYLVMDGAQPLDIQVGPVVGPTMDIPMFSSGNMSYKHPH